MKMPARRIIVICRQLALSVPPGLAKDIKYRVLLRYYTFNLRKPSAPPPKNVKRDIYEYVDRKKKDTFFLLTYSNR